MTENCAENLAERVQKKTPNNTGERNYPATSVRNVTNLEFFCLLHAEQYSHIQVKALSHCDSFNQTYRNETVLHHERLQKRKEWAELDPALPYRK